MARSTPTSQESGSERSRRATRDYNVGLPARRVAVGLLHAVLANRQPLDEALVSSRAAREMVGLAERDRGLARAIASTALRRLGQIDDVLGTFLEKGVPKRSGPLRDILRAAVCQLLFLDMPAHAVIDLAVTQCKRDRNARHFDKLANAVLRRVDDRGRKLVAAQDAARLNTPEWLWARLIAAYGEDNTRRIAEAHLQQAPLDLSVKQNPDDWAKHLNGTALPTGSVRISHSGSIEKLKGFASGDWWVQDAAAALPAKLFGNVANKRIADLCAAPGGKTAQLAQAGAQVTAVDASEKRLERLAGNMDRLGLKVETVCADAGAWRGEKPFDAVLLDAPCTGTGTLRRHPDIAHLKSEQDLAELTRLQARLLRHATSLLQPGGMLVYCTCSLEREEGNDQITDLLSESPGMRRAPIESVEFNGPKSWITDEGDLRTLPFDLPADDTGMSGVDGFFAARLVMN